jgi:hypothetical protein
MSAPAPADDRPDGLLAWQLDLYPANHTRRSTLLVHAISAPMFCVGCVALVVAPFTTPWLALVGLELPLALVMQGATHKKEATAPVPFRGPGDFVARFFAEQWVTFPRWVLSGGFAKAWRNAK